MYPKQIIIVTCIIVCLLACFSCSEGVATQKKRLQEIPVVELVSKDTFLQKNYVAKIEAVKNIELRNKVTGYLDKIYIDEGQTVKKGQLLFAINPQEYQGDVATAAAVLSNAKAEAKEAEVQMQRVKLLVDKKVISGSELDLARAKQNAAQAKIEEAQSSLLNAKTRLSYAYLHAPFDGIVDRIPFKVGSLLAEGSLLSTLSDVSSVYAYFNIAEDEYLRYLKDKLTHTNSRNSEVQLTLADGSLYPQMGKIETMTSEFDEATGSISFRAKFSNPRNVLRHGATGELILRTKADSVLLVPQKSVFEIQDKSYVYLLDDNNAIKMKSFVPQSRIANFYVVQSGLEPGDKIVYQGIQNLKEGMSVAPKRIDMLGLFHTKK